MLQIMSSLMKKKPVGSCLKWKSVSKCLSCVVLTLSIASVPNLAFALSIKDVPNPKQEGGWVTDMANVLSPETEAKINTTLSKLAGANGNEIAVVTVPETSPSATPKDFATDLFNYWGIGEKGKDNGVLVLISKGDRRVEIETGYGVENILPDALVGNIISQKITPQFKRGDFNKGTLAGTQALGAVLERQVSNTTSLNSNQIEQSDRSTWQWLYWLLGLGGVVVVGVIYVIKSRTEREVDETTVKSCPTCHKSMTRVDANVLKPMLTQPQQVAQKIGSVEFLAWHCPNCYPQINSLREVCLSKECLRSNRLFIKCPICRELTAERTARDIEPATRESVGKRLVIDACKCCSYQTQTERVIDRLLPLPELDSGHTQTNSSNSSSNDSYTSDSDWRSSSSGGYSSGSDSGYSGSSDWGGGSSGGGGAGDSW